MYPSGSPVNVPRKLLDNKALHCLANSLNTGKPYNDRKCFFRCAALYLGADVKHLEKATNKLVKEYCEKGSVQNFNGVTLDELEDVSRFLNIPINVYEMSEEYTELLFSTTLRTTDSSGRVMNLFLHEDHFMYIKDLDKFSSSYRCHKCDKLFAHSGHFNRHLKTCSVGIKKKFVGGNFRLKPTIFEILEGYGVNIPKQLRQFQFRAVFDIECLLRNTDRINTAKTEYTSEHELLSVSVCSNVPGFQKPRCFVIDEAGGQRKVVKLMLEYLNTISETAAALTREEMKEFMPAIEGIDNEKVKERFNNWLNQLPVLSYNGGRYDLQVIRKELIPLLTLADSVKFVIKKESSYMCIVTEQLKFLDVMFYVAPGKSYAQFLMAYGATLKKSFFPYVYMDSFEKLKVDTFPEYNAFFSNLKNKNTLEPSVGAEMTLEDVQKAGLKNYTELRTLFEVNKWTMKEFLIYYNNLDTEPFIEALENLTSYYFDRGVDVFKDAISAPGIAERVAFMSLGEGSCFSLFSGKHKDLVQLFLDNNVGGPALIFDRKAVVGQTRIRHDENGKLCKKVLGLDANALYLGCMAEEMPCGMFIRRRAENTFKKEYPTPVSAECIQWLAWLEASQDITIQHAKNGLEFQAGKKKRAVDGYCESLKTIYQYQGCLYHGCEACFAEDRDTPRDTWPSHNDKREKTRNTTEYLESEGYKVVEMWGCEWRKLRKTVTLSTKYNLPYEDCYRMTEGQILKAVSQGEIFGAIEVDIHVPENLKYLYSEMTPVFKNVTVTRDDIGEHMDAYLTDTKQNFPDTRYLIGSMFGTKMLLTTPLAKWYMDHGLVITKVYQLIQFKPVKCFEKFADMVSNDRRSGDMDKNNAIKAETSKLLGNSVYGHSIMRKDLHNSVRFVTLDKASKLVNDPRFTGLTEFDQETFEVTSQKKTITYDLPLQIGFWTYQLAKLKMLSFFYDVIDKYISRKDYCLLEMDTDSLYLSLSAATLDELVKPHLKVEWEREKDKWFPRTDTPENRAFDKRKPGLFKVEFDGVGFVGLNAKTYFCWSEQGKSKYSSKGVSHSHPLSAKDYTDVLEKTPINPQINRGFVRNEERIFTYMMKKDGLKYFYAKRKVLANGMSTTHLDI